MEIKRIDRSKKLEDLENFLIKPLKDVSESDLSRNVYDQDSIHEFIRVRNETISESFFYYFSDEIRKRFREFFIKIDLKAENEKVFEALAFAHAAVREFFDVKLLVVSNSDFENSLAINAVNGFPLNHVFYYSDSFSTAKNMFRQLIENQYLTVAIEPLTSLFVRNSEYQKMIFQEYSRILKKFNLSNNLIKNLFDQENLKELIKDIKRIESFRLSFVFYRALSI